jgi:hypothetical protein
MPGDFFAHFAELNANGSLFCAYHNLVIGNYDHRIVYRADHTTELFMFLKDISGLFMGVKVLMYEL